MSTDKGFWGRLRSVGPEALQGLVDDHVAEGIQLEFKRFSVPATGVFDIHDLAGVLCGMANTAGGRVILGAVPDKDERLVGFDGVPGTRVRAVLQRVQEAAASVQPAVNVALHTVDTPGGSGRAVVIGVALDGSGPRQHQGRYLMRVDSTNRPMPHSMVVSAVLDARSRGREIAGWMGSALEGAYPFEQERRNEGATVVDHWALGTLVRAPSPLPPFCDPGGDMDDVSRALASESLDGAHLRLSNALFKTKDRLVVLDYRGSASEVGRGDLAPDVRIAVVEKMLRESVPRLSRLLVGLGYRGPVEVHAKLFHGFSSPLKVQWKNGDCTQVIWATQACLDEDVLLSELIDPELGHVERLTERFSRLVARNVDVVMSR
jgi:hypothetical protein